jgi:hypothetical protein
VYLRERKLYSSNIATLFKNEESSKIPSLMNQAHDSNKKFASTPVDLLHDLPAPLDGKQSPDVPELETTAASQTSTEKLRVVFPHLSEAELSGLAEILHGYCAIVWRIYERLARDHPSIIDELVRSRSIKGKVDSSN